MSELEDLGDIADQCHFGTGKGGLSARNTGKNPKAARCGSPDHMKGVNIRAYRAKPNGKLRTACRLCDKARRRKARPVYNMQGYPL